MAVIQVFGRLTGDPENKPGNDGRAIAHFSLADNHGKDNQGQDKVSFFRCSAFGKQAELILASCKKGHRLNVSGRFESRQYTGNSGPQTSLDVSVQNFDFVELRDQTQPAPPAQAPAPVPAAQPQYQRDAAGNYWTKINNQMVMTHNAQGQPVQQAPAPVPAASPVYAAPAQQYAPPAPQFAPVPPHGCPPNERPF